MTNKYESPELDIVWMDYDVLTASDNDVPFPDNDVDDEDQDWGQYY